MRHSGSRSRLARQILLSLFLAALCRVASANPPVRCKHYFSRATPAPFSTERARVRSAIGHNYFVTNRTLYFNALNYRRTYLYELGSSFLDRLRGLGPGQRWLDVGAGEALAMLNYLLDPTFQHKVELTAIAVSIPEEARIAEIQAIAPSFRYVAGRIESVEAEALGEFDLITDVVSALAYSEDVSATLRAEIRRLSVGGTLMASGMWKTRFLQNRSDPNSDSYDDLTHWLAETSTGLSVRGDNDKVIVTRNAREFSVADVELVEFTGEIPPNRAFLAPRSR